MPDDEARYEIRDDGAPSLPLFNEGKLTAAQVRDWFSGAREAGFRFKQTSEIEVSMVTPEGGTLKIWVVDDDFDRRALIRPFIE